MEELIGREKNSIVFRRPEEPFGDISDLGVIHKNEDYEIKTFPRLWHDEFKVGDVVYYNIQNKEYELAIARNTKQSEAVGVIYSLTETTFDIIFSGFMDCLKFGTETEQAIIPEATPVWLSDSVWGGMTLTKPTTVAKMIGLLYKTVILIRPDTGTYLTEDDPSWDVPASYTQQELDDIISKTWWREKHG